MRIKPKEDWHNFDYDNEIRLGELEIAISLSETVLRKFVDYAMERLSNKTGIRFKFIAEGSREVVTKKEGRFLAYQLFSKQPYIFPNESEHTNRFDSPYNRVEFYIPLSIIQNAKQQASEIKNG